LIGILVTWRWRRQRALLLSLWAFAILFIVPVSFVGRRGDRYILPVYLPLNFLAAISLGWLNTRISSGLRDRINGTLEKENASPKPDVGRMPTGSRNLAATPRIAGRMVLSGGRVAARSIWQIIRDNRRLLAATILAGQFLFVLAFYPYYFPYLNPLLGGPLTAPWLINIGWGEGLDQAARYLNAQPPSRRNNAAAWYSGQFAPFFRGYTFDIASNEPALTADRAVFYINQVQRQLPSQELVAYFANREPEHVVRLGGVDYATIYRGPVIGYHPPDRLQFPTDVTLGGAVHLIGYDIGRDSTRTDEEIGITLYWDVLAPLSDDYNVYVRLVDDSGTVWGQVDRLPLGGLWRTTQWEPGTYIKDEYRMSLLPGTPPDTYRLEVSMYSFESGETFGLARNIGSLEVTAPGHKLSSKDIIMQHTLRKTVAPGLELMGYDLGEEKIGPGQRLPVTLYWRTTRRLDTDYTVTLEAKSVAGNEGGSWVETIGSDMFPTSQWRWGEIVVNVYQLQMPAYARSGFYVLNAHITRADTGEIINREILGKTEFVERQRNFESPQIQYPVGATLGDKVQLIGYDLPEDSVFSGGSFPLTLYWRALDEMNERYTVFVHVVGLDGVIRGQWDHEPGAGDLPTTGWLEGEVITDQYLVPMEEDAPPWRYTIIVGMYDTRTGERLRESGGYQRDYISLGEIGVKAGQ
jgi:hypothetical protein